MSIFYIFYLLLIKSIFVHSETFTSTAHLTHLLNTEIELARQLEAYLEEDYKRLNRVEKYLNFSFKIKNLIIFFTTKDFSMLSKMKFVKHKKNKIIILVIQSMHIYLSNI